MAGVPLNIASYLPRMARQQPDALAVVVQDHHVDHGKYTYTLISAHELDQDSDRVANGLRGIGIEPGVRTVLMVKPSVEFFTLTFALFKAGAIPIMVDPGMGTRNLKICLAEARPEAFVGIPKAHAARVLLGWGRGTNRINVTVGRRMFWGGHRYRQLLESDAEPVMADTTADDMAAILFTSGSTGVPKGAIYTHGNFDAQVRCLRDDYGIEPGERDLATFPLFALFGPALGMAAIVPDMDASKPITANPRSIIAAIEDFEATNLFASPALIEKVGVYGAENKIELPSLKRVISAGAPADPASLERFSRMLAPNIPVVPSYGATEALPVARINHDELLKTSASTDEGAGVCVGRPVKNMQLRIIKIDDEPIRVMKPKLECAPGIIGEICVRGPVATTAYFNREESTALAKIKDPDDGTLWHRMGDVGYLDDEGRLWFCGRKAHRVRVGKETLFTIPIERIFNTHPKIRRTALVGVESEEGTVPILCVELLDDHKSASQDQVRQELADIAKAHKQTKSIEKFLFHPKFPVDIRHNAKIFREQLADWAREQIK